jgi:hypothetical protein
MTRRAIALYVAATIATGSVAMVATIKTSDEGRLLLALAALKDERVSLDAKCALIRDMLPILPDSLREQGEILSAKCARHYDKTIQEPFKTRLYGASVGGVGPST